MEAFIYLNIIFIFNILYHWSSLTLQLYGVLILFYSITLSFNLSHIYNLLPVSGRVRGVQQKLKFMHRDSKGRFRPLSLEEQPPFINLTQEVMDPLIENLLGDGSLRFTHKGPDGKPKPGCNANYVMTLKSKDYIYHLWENIYSSICTSTLPRPWPNPKSGKQPTQYNFSSKTLPALSLLHSQWYKWSEAENKFIKIVPLNIEELLTPIGLAHWIMDDGFKVGNGVGLCTESFTFEEVSLLKKVLEDKFKLIITMNVRKTSTGKIGYRLFISAKSRNQLLDLVKSFFIPSMVYKLSL
jgi:hypothetical protein